MVHRYIQVILVHYYGVLYTISSHSNIAVQFGFQQVWQNNKRGQLREPFGQIDSDSKVNIWTFLRLC